MMRLAIPFLLAGALAAVPAAAQTGAGPGCERCATIESIRPVTVKDQWAPLGTVSASPQGSGAAPPAGVTMVQIGPGFSNQGTVLIGAAGGAAYRTRPSQQLNATRWEIVLRMDAGGARSVTQNYEPMLRAGDRVRVSGTQLELVQ
jgi:outer membrane lipoprotein SlyB